MYAAEQLFNSLTYEDLFYTLKNFSEEDCYLQDFLVSSMCEDFLYMLDVYDLIFIASDDRILLTSKGEKVLQYVSNSVELEKYSSKVKKKL